MDLREKCGAKTPFEEFEPSKGQIPLGKGLFWLTKDRDGNYEFLCFKINCYRDGVAEERAATGKCEAEKVGHRQAWAGLDEVSTQGEPYDYFPRGKVQIKRGKATISLSPALNAESVLKEVCRAFGITIENGIVSVRVVEDKSRRYRFFCKEI